MEYEFHFIPDKEQYKKTLKEWIKARNKLKRSKAYRDYLIITKVFLIMVFIAFLCVSKMDILESIIVFLIFVIGLFLLGKVLNHVNLYNLQQMKYMGYEHCVNVNNKFIKLKLKHLSITYEWECIKTVVISGDFIFVVTLEDKYIFVPISAFKDMSKVIEFDKYVKDNIENITYKNKIVLYIEAIDGKILFSQKVMDETGPFYQQEKGKYIYKYKYIIGDEVKEGWVRFGNTYGADWKL